VQGVGSTGVLLGSDVALGLTAVSVGSGVFIDVADGTTAVLVDVAEGGTGVSLGIGVALGPPGVCVGNGVLVAVLMSGVAV
jgi:hypothetical protein